MNSETNIENDDTIELSNENSIKYFSDQINEYIICIDIDDINKLDPSKIIHIVDYINDSYDIYDLSNDCPKDIIISFIKLANLVLIKSELFINSYNLYDLVKYDTRTSSIIFIIKNYKDIVSEMNNVINKLDITE